MLPGVRRWVFTQNEHWKSLIFLSQQSDYRRAGALKGHTDHLDIERERRKAGQETFDLIAEGADERAIGPAWNLEIGLDEIKNVVGQCRLQKA